MNVYILKRHRIYHYPWIGDLFTIPIDQKALIAINNSIARVTEMIGSIFNIQKLD